MHSNPLEKQQQQKNLMINDRSIVSMVVKKDTCSERVLLLSQVGRLREHFGHFHVVTSRADEQPLFLVWFWLERSIFELYFFHTFKDQFLRRE